MILVTGTGSGLGRFLQEKLHAQKFSRQSNINDLYSKNHEPFEAIIHCAYNTSMNVSSNNFQQYVADNILLTQRLLTLPHKKFIFISTSDVYPKQATKWHEDAEFAIDEIANLYGTSKLMAEMVVKATAKNFLILRPTAMLGNYARSNSLMKILFDDNPKLTLSEHSTFNYILHTDILDFIQLAISNNIQGTFNLAAANTVSLAEIANTFNRKINFGGFTYQTADICNLKASEICSAFANTSIANISRFTLTLGATHAKTAS